MCRVLTVLGLISDFCCLPSIHLWGFVVTVCCFLLLHAVNCGRFCFWRHQSVVFMFVYKISWEPLNRFAPNSHGRRILSLAPTSLKSMSPGTKKRHFWPFWRPACGLFLVKHLFCGVFCPEATDRTHLLIRTWFCPFWLLFRLGRVQCAGLTHHACSFGYSLYLSHNSLCLCPDLHKMSVQVLLLT